MFHFPEHTSPIRTGTDWLRLDELYHLVFIRCDRSGYTLTSVNLSVCQLERIIETFEYMNPQ